MSDTVKAFIERVDRLEARYAKDKYATTFQMPRELMLALRDELKERLLQEVRHREMVNRTWHCQESLPRDISQILNDDFYKMFEKF